MAAFLPASVRTLFRRRALLFGILAGAATFLLSDLWARDFAQLTRWLAAWDAGVGVYMLTLFWILGRRSAADLAAHADETDESRYFVLIVSLMAVVASTAAVGFELLEMASVHGSAGWRIGFVFFTVALSWSFVHASFASHYAHEYFGSREDGGVIRGGLHFPGGEEPDFWDMVHFSYVIGVAAQTADIEITTKPMRRVVTVHGVVTFLLNTVILALTINFAAGLFQSH